MTTTLLATLVGLLLFSGLVVALVWMGVRLRYRRLAVQVRVLRDDCAVLEEENSQLGAENIRLKLALDTTRALLRTRVREGPAAVAPLH
jgi:cell division protein FtsB